jgi:hypothetical protein
MPSPSPALGDLRRAKISQQNAHDDCDFHQVMEVLAMGAGEGSKVIDDAYVAGLIEYINGKFGNDLLGVLVGGSRINGTHDATSDLDIVVVAASSRLQRWHFFCGGTEVDAFIFQPSQLKRVLEDGRRDGRAALAHLIAAGQIIYDPKSMLPSLQYEAKAILAQGPPIVSDHDRFHIRHNMTIALRDLASVDANDAERVVFLIGVILPILVDQHYRLAKRWPKKKKHILADLTLWDRHAADLVRRACNTQGTLEDQCTAVLALGRHVLVPVGGPMPDQWIA